MCSKRAIYHCQKQTETGFWKDLHKDQFIDGVFLQNRIEAELKGERTFHGFPFQGKKNIEYC